MVVSSIPKRMHQQIQQHKGRFYLTVLQRLERLCTIAQENNIELMKMGSPNVPTIEEFLGKQVNLKTHVKVIEEWREKEKSLRELGFNDLKD